MIKQRVTQYTVPVKNQPGAFHRMAQALAKEGVNITAIMSENSGDVVLIRFLSEKENNLVRRPLESAGYEVFEQPCFEVDLANRPGELGRLAWALSDEDIKILNIYGATGQTEAGKIVLVVDQPEKAQMILGHLAEKAYATA